MKVYVKCSPHLTLQDSKQDTLIITLIDAKINIHKNSFYCSFDRELLHKLKSFLLLRRKSLTYKFLVSGQEKQLKCPMLKFPGRKNVALWPSIKLPNRKYPIYVYIYAAALYLSSKISMREAALRTRQEFGQESFSHSTLSRVLKKLSLNVYDILPTVVPAPPGSPFIERAHWSVAQVLRHKKLLSLIEPVLIKGNEIAFCSMLNYNFFNRTQKFLL